MPEADWLETLRLGCVSCRVLHENETVCLLTPTLPEHLWAPIRMRDTGGAARGPFWQECRDFIESGEKAARYAAEACETIVKFGTPIQFREPFWVEFSRT